MQTTETAREARARRLAKRLDLKLRKSRFWDDAGTYCLIDLHTNCIVASGYSQNGYGLSLDEVETVLAEA